MFIDPHAHMISRTTDDYEAMARAGVVAVIDRRSGLASRARASAPISITFDDHRLRALPRRPVRIRHYCTVYSNPEEAKAQALAEGARPCRAWPPARASAVGELGYDEQTEREDRSFRADRTRQTYDLPIMIHTPHRDKKRGTLQDHGCPRLSLRPRRVVDYNNEETVWRCWTAAIGRRSRSIREPGCRQRAHDRDRAGLRAGSIIVDSACDRARPTCGPQDGRAHAGAGHPAAAIRQVTYANAPPLYGLNGEMREVHWTDPRRVDQRTLYEGNSVLRGGQTPRIEAPARSTTDLIV